MKICMLVTNSVRKDPRVQREAISCRNSGIDTVVIGCNDLNYDKEFIDSLPYRVLIYKLPLKYRGSLHSLLKKLMRMLLPIVNMKKLCIIEKPDIIHANDFDTLPAAVKAAKKLKCGVVYDSHEIYTEQPSLKKYPIIKRIIQIIERHYIKKVDCMLSVSNAAAAEFARKYHINPPTVITNAVNYIEVGSLPPKSKEFEVLYHGIVNANRGYEEFAEASKYYKGAIFVIRGYGERIDAIKELKKKYGLNNLRIDEPVEIKELVPYAARSYVGVVLTKPVADNFKYTVSNKLFEYVQARIPVIMSDIPEHRYLNDKYHFGVILDEITPNAIASTVEHLHNDQAYYASLLKSVTAMAESVCWESEEKRLIMVYNNIKKSKSIKKD